MIYIDHPPERAIKWLAFGCSHAPLQDADAIAFVQEKVKEWQPDIIIHLGDGLEADSAARWENEYDWTLKDELISLDATLKSIRNEHNDPAQVECIYLHGNHDDNLLTWNRVNKKLRDLVDWTVPQFAKLDGRHTQINAELLTQWTMPTRYRYDRQSTYRIGACIFGHGWEASVSADEMQSINLGWPNGLFVSAHTHRPTEGTPRRAMKTKAVPLDRYYLNAGCTRDLNPQYMERKRKFMWGHGVTYGWSVPVNSPRMSPNTWDAYCEVLRMAG